MRCLPSTGPELSSRLFSLDCVLWLSRSMTCIDLGDA